MAEMRGPVHQMSVANGTLMAATMASPMYTPEILVKRFKAHVDTKAPTDVKVAPTDAQGQIYQHSD